MTQAIAKKAVLKNSKILATRIKEWQHHSKTQNHPSTKTTREQRLKSVKESKIPF
ncbi:hypothetical protein [Helicobacter pylori]|uniref:hypothetical protein n=1 Tax=Helicobacter pylori TaxID=210 RepID=UPI001F09A380|nr:hypothetical protein [Helicobacter pylori]